MFKKSFIACLLLWFPLVVLAKDNSVNETEFNAYKVLAQTKLDAAKESSQKDIQALEKRIERQDKLLDSFSTRISDLSYALTLLGLAAGLLGYFTVSSKAKNEARSAAEEWVEKKGKEILDKKLAEFDSHILDAKQSVNESKRNFENELGELRAAARPQLEESQRKLSISERQASSTTAQPVRVEGDAIGKLVEALKRKPEAEYHLADWNVRAHDAYNKGNFALAAEYWLQAAQSVGARGVEIAQALYNAGIALGRLNRNEEALAIYGEVVKRYGDAPEPALREQVAKALLNKAGKLRELNRSEEIIGVYDEVVKRYGDAPEPALREPVSRALASKGFRLLCLAKANWADETQRLRNLQESSALSTQAVENSNDKPIVWGNQAYAAFLLGQPEAARALLHQALQEGGEALYKATLDDIEIYPVPPDVSFRALLEDVWAEVKPKA